MLIEKGNTILLSGSTSANFTKQINNIDSLQMERARKFLKDAEEDLQITVNGNTTSVSSKSIDFDKLDELIEEE